jgi:hypothetical protein
MVGREPWYYAYSGALSFGIGGITRCLRPPQDIGPKPGQYDALTFAAIHDPIKCVEREGYTDRHGTRRKLVPSTPRGSLWDLAKTLYVRRAKFAPGVVLSDLGAALSSPDFDGLHGKGWGLLLSRAFIGRNVEAQQRVAATRYF